MSLRSLASRSPGPASLAWVPATGAAPFEAPSAARGADDATPKCCWVLLARALPSAPSSLSSGAPAPLWKVKKGTALTS